MFSCEALFVKVKYERYIADRKGTTCFIGKAFLLRCVNPAALPLTRCYSIRLPRRVVTAEWTKAGNELSHVTLAED